MAPLFSALYCTLLANAQTEKEKILIKERMKQDSHLAKILSQLETGMVDDSTNETTTVMRDVSKEDVVDSGNTAGQVPGVRRQLDLEVMAFTQGSHFMANDKCQLPDKSFRKQKKGM